MFRGTYTAIVTPFRDGEIDAAAFEQLIERQIAGGKMGVDGVLVVAPYYNKPSQEGLFRHFQAIARSTALPIMLYNIPGRCGVDIGADTVERLAYDCGNVVSIKEASGSVDR